MVSTTRHCKQIAWTLLLLIIVGAILLAGCETGPAPTPPPTQTAKIMHLVATFTPRSAASPTETVPAATQPPAPTPPPTQPPTVAPTATLVPTRTNTPKPKPTRTPAPPPTPTTSPFDFVILSGPAGERTPATTNFKGYVYDAAGQPLNGVWLWLREDGGWEAWTVTGYSSDPPGYYSYGLKDYSINGSWGLCIVKGPHGNRDVISPWARFQTSFTYEISTFITDWKRTR
jgi:hypothetical protein